LINIAVDPKLKIRQIFNSYEKLFSFQAFKMTCFLQKACFMQHKTCFKHNEYFCRWVCWQGLNIVRLKDIKKYVFFLRGKPRVRCKIVLSNYFWGTYLSRKLAFTQVFYFKNISSCRSLKSNSTIEFDLRFFVFDMKLPFFWLKGVRSPDNLGNMNNAH